MAVQNCFEVLHIFISDSDKSIEVGLIKFTSGRKLEGGVVNMVNERIMIQNDLDR